MSLEQVVRWDSNLIIIPALILGTGVALSLAIFAISRDRAVLRRSLMCPIAAVVAFNYYLAYRCITDIMTKFAQFDLVLPLYGLAVLMMFPFTINFLKLAWNGTNRIAPAKPLTMDEAAVSRVLEKLKDCRNIGIITPEAFDLCKAHLYEQGQARQ